MKCLFMIAFIISSLHGIPFIIYWNIIDLPGTEGRICAASDHQGVFSKYLIYVYLPIWTGFLPVLIMSILALIAFRKLTAIVLLKIGFLFLTIIPFIIVYIIQLITPVSNDLISYAENQLITTVFTMLYFASYAVCKIMCRQCTIA
jgi:hypothetical protein